MITPKSISGIVPGDILIKSAIEAGLADLRANPFLLDYCFAWTVMDDLTADVYGGKERQKAKNWFLNNEIFVTMNFRVGEPRFPAIAISLESSSEAESVLGDINDETNEEVAISEIEASPKPILGPFTPKSYDSTTGNLVLPDGLDTTGLYDNMVLVDVTTNTGYKISDVIDSETVRIDSGLNANFTQAFISPIDNFYVTTIESCYFRQSYKLSCFAQGDAVNALYLEQVLTFILMRYKETLLESRGFERSTISTGPVQAMENPNNTEITWFRDITISGYVRHYWPKLISQKVNGIAISNVKIIGGGVTPPAIAQEVALQGWDMDGDPF